MSASPTGVGAAGRLSGPFATKYVPPGTFALSRACNASRLSVLSSVTQEIVARYASHEISAVHAISTVPRADAGMSYKAGSIDGTHGGALVITVTPGW